MGSRDVHRGSLQEVTASGGLMPKTFLTPRQVALVAMIGTAVEIYDFLLYAFIAATVFGPLFFPGFHPWLGTLAAFSSHAVAFFIRPLGAALFARIGDRVGRRPALLGSLAMMGVATVGIGLIPTYSTIGITAPLLLVALRLVQGMAVGGEYPGAVVVAVEHAPPHRRTLYGSFPQIGFPLGILIVAVTLVVVNAAVGPAVFDVWGWRIPFLFSALLVIVGLLFRARLAETPEFVAAAKGPNVRRAAGAGQIRRLLREVPRPAAIGILMGIGPATFAYAYLTSLLAYVKVYVPTLPVSWVQLGLMPTATVIVIVAIASAHYGDRWGRERAIIISGVWLIFWAAPSYWLVGASSLPALLAAMMVGAVPYGIFSGIAPALTADLFPVKLRYIGVAASITIAVLIGGALLPIPALSLTSATNGSIAPMVIMMVIAGAATTVGGLLAYRNRAIRSPAPRVLGGSSTP
ncbi:MFS transporter [Micromonospora sp. NPDC002717]|uniref:MFS transporter n=1 Tax=Micromonospora sp. NPDC002717 TaxID=3154424 RepID=UPI00331AE07F